MVSLYSKYCIKCKELFVNLISSAPTIFDLGVLNHDCKSQWALCVANLTSLNASLDKYYTSVTPSPLYTYPQVLSKPYNNKYFDTVEISKNQKISEIHKMVQSSTFFTPSRPK